MGAGPGEELEGDEPECVDIGAGARFVGAAIDLFWGHVLKGAQELSGLGDHGAFVELHIHCDPEIEDLGLGIGGDEDVAGFEVAVDDADGVGVGDGSADLDNELDTLLDGG